MTDRGSANSQFGSVDCHDIHEHVALCPATYPPSKTKEKCDSISLTFAQTVRQPQCSSESREKRRAVDRLLADSASCRLVAKYCHRCGHRHLSDQVNSYAAPEAPPPPTNHLEESVLDGGFRRVTHRVGGKKDSVHGSFAVSLVPFVPSPLSSMRVIRHAAH